MLNDLLQNLCKGQKTCCWDYPNSLADSGSERKSKLYKLKVTEFISFKNMKLYLYNGNLFSCTPDN